MSWLHDAVDHHHSCTQAAGGDNDLYRARERQPGTALVFRKRLLDKCAKLARLSATLGTQRSELATGLRSTSVGNYLIFFRYDESRVTVVAVLHASRDMTAHFDNG
ncbi:type II toxin-antitoxin system RelE/ParE family toxin [Blastomonas aquatica]|uniref:Plasmid stabilization protein n=1 Tax=Blastomonas aquatica TaxID=1510276 RepID=A0ABQ1IYB7_9SPHN|nr:type II toxin-antitoxin system RelE/ParE family toxin [Blastomonas aquatica]GGB53329.1 hypothetical protein GCM10010833_05020 [Blastomonas aquatica]